MEHNPCVPSPDGLSVAFGSLPVGQTERQPSQKIERREAEPAQQNGRTPSPTVQARARGFSKVLRAERFDRERGDAPADP